MKKKLVSTIVTLAFAAATLMGCSTASAETTETASTEISKTDLAEEKEAATSEESTVEVATEDSAAGYTATEVHIAIQPSAAFIPLYVAREKGYIEEALAEYGVEVVWNDFESGPPMNE
jgi:sulfonate transport system substrate-binding protein